MLLRRVRSDPIVSAHLADIHRVKHHWGQFRRCNPDWFRISTNYSDNMTEGSRLSPVDTHLFFEYGITVSGQTLADLDAEHHFQAYDLVEKVAYSGEPLTFALVEKIHTLIYGKHLPIRTEMARPSGIPHLYPNPQKIPALLDRLMEEYHENIADEIDPLVAIRFGNHLASIRPWSDGNGRTARLCTTLLLLQQDLPPAYLDKTHRKGYIDACVAGNKSFRHEDEFPTSALTPIFNFYLERIKDSLALYTPDDE